MVALNVLKYAYSSFYLFRSFTDAPARSMQDAIFLSASI